MKKKLLLAFLCAMVVSTSGCAQLIAKKVASSELESLVESIKDITEGQTTVETGGDANQGKEDAIEEETTAKPQSEDAIEELTEESIEDAIEDPEKRAKESYLYYDQIFNQDPLDLTPKKGKYFSFDEEGFPVKDAKGTYFGYEDNLTPGCSVWCAVNDYKYTVDATSVLDPQGNNTYDAEHVLEPDITAGWVEGVDGDGIGESITIHATFDTEQESEYYDTVFFPSVCIVNGLAKSEKAWKNNGRVKTLNMYFNDEYICSFELLDIRKPQYISFSQLHLSAKENEVSDFKFEIADVYPGEKYEDTALTGIIVEMFTQNH